MKATNPKILQEMNVRYSLVQKNENNQDLKELVKKKNIEIGPTSNINAFKKMLFGLYEDLSIQYPDQLLVWPNKDMYEEGLPPLDPWIVIDMDLIEKNILYIVAPIWN